jgi:hypothetical protein
MDRGYLFGYRRSGNHLYMAIRDRFGQKPLSLCHDRHDHPHTVERLNRHDRHPWISIVRDGRDVMVSQYHYDINMKHISPGSFKDYLTGQAEWHGWDKLPTWYTQELREDPIKDWVSHVSGWLTVIPDPIKYEDLINKGPEMPLLGLFPRKGIIGDYKNYFDSDDLKRFDDLAGCLMVNLGYYK